MREAACFPQRPYRVESPVRKKRGSERTCKPGSVPPNQVGGDGHFSRKPIARLLQRSTRKSIADRTGPWDETTRKRIARIRCSLLDLAPGGVCLARLVAQPAGELLPHRFTLTSRTGVREAVCFLLHFPGPCDRWALPITMSCGARTFLPPAPQEGRYGGPRRHGRRPSSPLRTTNASLSYNRKEGKWQKGRIPAGATQPRI